MSRDIVITNARLLGRDAVDIRVSGQQIVSVEPTGATTASAADRESGRDADLVIDGSGLIALPGLVDLGAHLRQPGLEQVETVTSASQAAALGGFTAMHALPDTDPVADTAGNVELVHRLGLDAGYVDVRPIGAVTVGMRGDRLAEIGAMAYSTAQVRVFSDSETGITDPLLLRRALEYVKPFDGVIAQHAQDPLLTKDAEMNEGELSSRLGLHGWPAVAEASVIARDVLLADHVGARLHVRHVSAKGSVDVLRWAKQRGIDVTADVTPHHLALTEELIAGYDPRYKVNPPLRAQADVEALREGLADGTIDAIATDHAPQPPEAKECEWAHAEPGMLGLQTALHVAQAALVDTGVLSWGNLARVLSSAPAAIAGDAEQGQQLTADAIANLVLVDPLGSTTLQRDDIASLSWNSPWLGEQLPGRIVATISRGVPTVLDGSLCTPEAVRTWI